MWKFIYLFLESYKWWNLNKVYFEGKDNYEKYGSVFTKKYIFEKDGKDVISVDKKFGFVCPHLDKEIYFTTIFPDGKEKTIYYFPNEENEYCNIIFIDDLVEKKSRIYEKTKFIIDEKKTLLKVLNITYKTEWFNGIQLLILKI